MSKKKPYVPEPYPSPIGIPDEPNLVYFVVLERENNQKLKPYDVVGEFVFPFAVPPSKDDFLLMGDETFRVHYGNRQSGSEHPQHAFFATEGDNTVALPIRYLVAEEEVKPATGKESLPQVARPRH